MISLCVTTFNRQDLLGRMLESAFAGSLQPDHVFLIDQANRADLIPTHLIKCPFTILDLGHKRGCEASAINWYLENVPEERIIAHDDVVFGYDSLRKFVDTEGAFLIDDQQGVITYRDECVKAVGLYDTEMSPNYFRYVDADYEDRLAEVGIEPTVVYAGIKHERDGTMKGYQDLTEYYRRVGLANDNYERKWGRPLTPGASTIGRSQWRASQMRRTANG